MTEMRIIDQSRLFVKGRKYDYVVKKQGFIQRIEKDKIQDICIHLANRNKFPDTDNVISMKLLIENDEELVERMANKHGHQPLPDELPLAACM